MEEAAVHSHKAPVPDAVEACTSFQSSTGHVAAATPAPGASSDSALLHVFAWLLVSAGLLASAYPVAEHPLAADAGGVRAAGAE